MTVYLEIAQRLQQEIEAAKSHLSQLNTALEAMQPLITLEMGTTGPSIKALGYKAAAITDVSDAELVKPEIADESALDRPVINSTVSAKKRRPKRKDIEVEVAAKKPSRRPQADASPDKLPATSGTFWMSLMGKRAYSVADIVERAIAKLEVTEEARPVLTNRLSAWLYPSMKAGKVQPGLSKGKLKRYQVVTAE